MRSLLLLCSLLLVAACGGGGSEVAGAQSDLLSGSYRYVSLASAGGVTTAVTTARAQSDGVSTLTLTSRYDVSEGSVVEGLVDSFLSYEVAADRGFSLPDHNVEGRISANGMVAAGSSRTHPARWSILYRRHEAPTLADLAGTWLVMRYRRLTAGWNQSVSRRLQTISALGVAEYTEWIWNADGQLDPPIVGGAADTTYEVLPDGSLLADPVVAELRGDLSEDGNLMVLAGDTAFGQLVLWVMVRMDNQPVFPDFNGIYNWTAWQTVPLTGLPVTSLGHWSVFGPTIDTSITPMGAVTPVGSSMDYTFGADGLLDAVESPAPPGLRVLGVLAPSGEYGFVGGGWAEGNRPTLAALIR